MRGTTNVNSKKLAGAGAAAIGAATAVTVLLLGSTAASAQETRPDSAYGLAASGLVTINPTPYVESDGDPVSDELLGLGVGGIGARVLTVEAGGGAAESKVTELEVLDLLKADLVRTYCDEGTGGLQIVGGKVLGVSLPETPLSGQTIEVSPLLKLTLGEKTPNSDGSVTVTGIELSVLPDAQANRGEELTSEERQSLPLLGNLLGADLGQTAGTVGEVVDQLRGALGSALDVDGAVQTVTVGSATCSPVDQDEPEADEPTGDDVPEAPKPEIVKADLPVTG